MKLYPLLCCLFSVLLALPTNHGEVQSVTNSLLHMEWVEEIVLTNWRYGEELALYEINGYANREDIVSIQEERLPLLMELDFNMFGLESSQLRLYNMIQHFLSAIRINFGSKIEFSGIWFYSKGYLGRDEVVSLISERRTLQHAAHRFLDLIEMDATEFDADYRRAICNRFSSGLTNVSLFLDALAMRYTDLCAEGHDDILLEAGALFDELVIVPLSTETSELDSAVDALLLKPFLQHYQEISLDQYLRHRFCQDLAINRSVTTTSVLNRASTSIYRDGVGVVNGLYVVDHPLDMAWDWDAEVAVAASFLSVPPSIPSSSSCSLRIRALYATVGLNHSQVPDMSARGGAAAHSMRRLLCCSMDGNNEEESSFCLPSAVAPMSWTYHILFLAAAIPLSPPPRSLPPSDTIRALAVGLGGGELLTSLLAFFPQMDVTAVDISAETVNLSLRYFHMHDAICSVHLLDSDDNGTLLRPHDAFQQHIDDRREQSMVHLKSPTSSCRSHLILADVWKLLDHYVTPRSGEQHDSKVTFHYIFFDVFDAVAGTWGGSSYEGVSNVVPPNIRHSLQSIYQLLDEQYGLALFHLHKDGNFMGYWREIQEVFGRSRTALLELAGGNAVVAVSKAAFYVNSHAYDNILAKLQSEHCDQHGVEGQECSWRVDDVEYWEAVDSAHPCDFPVAAVRREFAFAEAMGYPDDWRWMGSYALNCTNHNQF